MDADSACLGARFIATREGNAHPDFKQMSLGSAPRAGEDRMFEALIRPREAGRVVGDRYRLFDDWAERRNSGI